MVMCLLVLLLVSCAPGDAQPNKAKAALEKGGLLVDVRSKEEFDGGHIEGAIHIPHTEVKERLEEFPKEKTKPIVVYCRSGRRSGLAKGILEETGYTQVINGGGYEDLKSKL